MSFLASRFSPLRGRDRLRALSLHGQFFATARRCWNQLAIADSTGQRLTYGRALTAALLFAHAIRRRTPGERMVGLLLPASAGGALANIGTLAAGRIPVNLNFTAGGDSMAVAIERCGINTILTSRKFLERSGIALKPTPAGSAAPVIVFLEDLRAGIGAVDKLTAAMEARFLPLSSLNRRYGPVPDADNLATVIFSSGSTGSPKGVMLSHRNILANIDGFADIFPMTADDCFIGVLPFFHSFGLTGTLWFPLLSGCAVVFHPNPMDAKVIGELAAEYKATMLIATPTFVTAYMRRCTREQFAHMHHVVVGAEKLRQPLADAFHAQYGIELTEGYGCTEMSPVVAVNTAHAGVPTPSKPGSVGRPIKGVLAKVVDQHTGKGPLVDQPGLLLVRGDSLMRGYLEEPERTAEAMRDGWYVTGDVASMDADGFITITDRVSRFSKIGGEMVPHLRIEDAINDVLGEAAAAVTALPDEARGERIIAFYTKSDVTPAQIWEGLSESPLPKLWLPRRDNIHLVDALPTLGSGKLDLRGLRELAQRMAG
jgi:acyl-[acyl-carrier-protein]-phospholipid O-acyltransferase/long-chain-fatty-acid--[acyl-carrier-protein] ligase